MVRGLNATCIILFCNRYSAVNSFQRHLNMQGLWHHIYIVEVQVHEATIWASDHTL